MKYFIVSFILLSLILQCILSIKDKVVTYDEPAHLPAGYSYLFIRDFRMNPEHPPLIKMIAALPLLFLNLKHPKQMRSWQGKDAYAFGVEFLYHSGQDADKIIFWGRIPIIFLSLLLGLSVFFWAERLFGFKAGIFALFLYSFSPIILAHSRLVTYDIGVSLFITLAFYSLWKYLNQPSNSRVILSGMSLGLALLSKFNAIILIPSFIALIYIYRPKRRFSHFVIILFLIFLIAFFTLWVGYGFETGKVLEDQKTHNTFNLLMKNYPKPLQNVVYFLGRYLTLPMPSYFKGLGWTAYCNLQKHESFLCGRHFRGSSFFDFLIAFLIKTPIPFLTFLLFSILVVIKNKIFFKRDQIFLLVLPGIIFIATSISAYSLHLKYVLPIYPLFCIFISQIVNYNFLRLKTIRFLFLGMCVWYFLGTLNIYPHYLAYFNEFVGGPANGYKCLVDSNLDWGQDLKLLKQYLDKNNIEEINLAYFGTADPAYYKINYRKLEPLQLASGWIGISATYLQGVHTVKGGYDWLKEYQPIIKIGYSIFVYNIKIPKQT